MVFLLTEFMEKVVRKHLNDKDMHTYLPGTDLRDKKKQEITRLEVILTISDKYEKYSTELLTVITDLWILIRAYICLPRSGLMKFEGKG